MSAPSASPSYPITWDLDSLYSHPASDAFGERLNTFETDLTQLAEWADGLPTFAPDNAGEWGGFLENVAEVERTRSSLGSFIGCHSAADAGNRLFQSLEARMAAAEPTWQRVMTGLDLGLRAASDDDFEATIAANESLSDSRFFLEERRELAGLRLPKAEEDLAASLAVDGLHAWGRLYDRLSGELRVQVMERGELVEKSVSQVQLDSPERSVRENNFFASNRAWDSIADTCADAINHIAGSRLTIYNRLGLEDHLTVPLAYNRMSRETLSAMWAAIADRKPMLDGYLAAKARLLGIESERLSWFDFSAPLPNGVTAGGSSGRLDWQTACERVCETFNGFSPEFGEFADHALAEGWIEAENRAGKRQGGFCTGFPSHGQSRIFMTFTHSPDSMSTLAHELGHAYHSWVLKDQPVLLQDYPMGLAETASTFAEAVLGDQQLRNADGRGAKLAILDQMLSDSVAFLMNIHARFIFEDNFHRERAAGEVPTSRLSQLMADAQREAYRGQLASGGDNPLFWVSKLHFYITGYPFYNFPYTFGYLLSLGLYAMAEQIGDEFPERYRKFLVATGCSNSEEAVQGSFGEDLTGPDFWNRSLDIVQRRVDEYVSLANG